MFYFFLIIKCAMGLKPMKNGTFEIRGKLLKIQMYFFLNSF